MNNTVELIKASSLAPVIAVGNLAYSALVVWIRYDDVLECMVLLLLFYGVVTYTMHTLGAWIEGRLRIPGCDATGHTALRGAAHA